MKRRPVKIKESGWKMLAKRYRERGIVLALGAGVSADSGIPDWGGLLERMAINALGENGENCVRSLMSSGWTLPAIASLIDSSRGHTTLHHLCRTALYRNFPFNTPADTEAKRRELVDFVDPSNSTMRAVAALCAVRRNGKIVANNRIAAVVNFNLDSILRSFSRAKYREWHFRTVKSADSVVGRGRIPVYHMHGLVPFSSATREENSSAEKLVLTEQQYFDFFNRPNSVFNYTFLTCFVNTVACSLECRCETTTFVGYCTIPPQNAALLS